METLDEVDILRAMKHLFALALPLFLSACASDLAPEDRDFFYRGWTHPEQAAQERMNGGKSPRPPDAGDTVRHSVPDPNSPN